MAIPTLYTQVMQIETKLNGQSPLRGSQPRTTPKLPDPDGGDHYHPQQSVKLQMAGAGIMLGVLVTGGIMYGPQAYQQAQVQAQKTPEAAAVATPAEAVKQAVAPKAAEPEPQVIAQQNAPTTLFQPVEEASKPAESETATLTQELQALRAELKQMKETSQEVRDAQKREQARRDAKAAVQVGGAVAEMGLKVLICAISDCH